MSALYALTSPEFLPFAVGLAAILGAVVGSFMTLATYRMPRDEKIGATHSQCTNCSTTLRVPDLVPVLSWLAAKGKCRSCAVPISPRYPLTEIASAIGAAFIIHFYHVTPEALALCILWWSVVSIFVTDLEHYIILDEVQVIIALSGIFYGWSMGFSWIALASAAFAGLAIGLALKYGFIWLRHKDGLGMGDVKFLCAAGIWLADPASFIPFLFFSGLLGIISGVLWKMLGQGERFPFGPALAMALLLCVLFPQAAIGFWQLYGTLDH